MQGLGMQTRKRLTILVKAGESLSASLSFRAAQTGHQAKVCASDSAVHGPDLRVAVAMDVWLS